MSMSIRFQRIALLLLAAFLYVGCDSGKDNGTDLIVPSSDDVVITSLVDNGPEIMVAAAERTSYPASVIPSYLTVSPAGNMSTKLSLGTGSQATTGTGSLLVDATTGAVSSKILVVPATGSSYVSDLVSGNPDSPAISSTDSKGNSLTYRFDRDMNFQSVAFQPGSSAGAFSTAYATRVNTVMSKQRSAVAQIKVYEDLSVADVFLALLTVDAAGKTFRDVSYGNEDTHRVILTAGDVFPNPSAFCTSLPAVSSTCQGAVWGASGRSVGTAVITGLITAITRTNDTGGSN